MLPTYVSILPDAFCAERYVDRNIKKINSALFFMILYLFYILLS
jgi:hypothetical protein